jgi:ribosomal protein L25 (general stress protein Ctc)
MKISRRNGANVARRAQQEVPAIIFSAEDSQYISAELKHFNYYQIDKE